MALRSNILKKPKISISEYGLGAWAIGGKHYGDVEEEHAKAVIRKYLLSGGNFIDTARGYGESERLIGDVLHETGLLESTVIATKTVAGESKDTIDQIHVDLEESLRQLRRSYVDIFFLHFPPEDKETMDLALNECLKLKEQGLIKAIGASIKGPDVTSKTIDMANTYIKDGRTDVLLMVYSIFRQMSADVFKEAEANDVGIVLRTVMESGFLTGALKKGTKFPDSDHRSRWNSQIDDFVDEVKNIEQIALSHPYEGINEIAIRFAAQSAFHTSIILGAENENQLNMNFKAFNRPPLSSSVIDQLKDVYGGMTERFNSGFGLEAFDKD